MSRFCQNLRLSETIKIKLYNTSCFHGDHYEEFRLLGCHAVWPSELGTSWSFLSTLMMEAIFSSKHRFQQEPHCVVAQSTAFLKTRLLLLYSSPSFLLQVVLHTFTSFLLMLLRFRLNYSPRRISSPLSLSSSTVRNSSSIHRLQPKSIYEASSSQGSDFYCAGKGCSQCEAAPIMTDA
jgi:hypothetical protein